MYLNWYVIYHAKNASKHFGLQVNFPVIIADNEDRVSLKLLFLLYPYLLKFCFIHNSDSFEVVNSPLNILTL